MLGSLVQINQSAILVYCNG